MKTTVAGRHSAYSRSGHHSYYQATRGGRHVSRGQSHSIRSKKNNITIKLVLFLIIGLGVFIGFNSATSGSDTQSSAIASPAKNTQSAVAPMNNECANNSSDKFIKVSINTRHMWACEKDKMVYDAPIITGIDRYEETITPLGVYKVYNKQREQVLEGSDSAGSWKRPVKYWMPFLHNEHGIYGFHDANWRPASDFGTIDPSSDKGSHGCIELPDASQKWLYHWAPIGTTLSVEP